MRTKIAIMIPAIIDQECADMLTESMKKNIIKVNPDCYFNFIVNIDDYRRHDCYGDVKSISKSYSGLAEENCSVDIVVHNPPLTLTVASRELFERFLNSDSDYLIFFDDDCEIINPIYFDEFIKLITEKVTLHLAFAYDDMSVENPFITNDVYFEGKTIKIFKNSKIFLTENGTIFTRKTIKNILNEYNVDDRKKNVLFHKFNPRRNPEDVIGALDSYKNKPSLTVAFKNDTCVVDNIVDGTKKLWRLSKKNHFIVDSIRHYRKVGWNR